MSKYDNHNTSHLPLIESVIIIAIFAVVSVFIMQLYVAADRLQGKSVNVSKATILAENTVEQIKAGELQLDPSDAVILDTAGAGSAVMRPGYVFYDKDWNVVSIVTGDAPALPDDAVSKGSSFYMTYVMNGVQKDDSGCYVTFNVTVNDIGVMTGSKGEQLACINAGKYIPCD